MSSRSPAVTTSATALSEPDLLSREFISEGGLRTVLAREAPSLRLLSDSELAVSLQATLAARPPGDVWIFGYGSLIWNTTVHTVESRTARVDGWHRSFCLSVTAGRGSIAAPGLLLGLDKGGECEGVAFRLDEETLNRELELLWRREMATAAYIPHWVSLLNKGGHRFGWAIAFTMNTLSSQYAGSLPAGLVARRIAEAAGSLGSCADYLFRTRAALAANGIIDPALNTLAEEVEAILPPMADRR
jgi:glutathione-specific gamma-glutamylcyclotransferase